MEISLTPEQAEFIEKYQKIYARLDTLDKKMRDIQTETAELLEELETLREEERKKFKTEED